MYDLYPAVQDERMPPVAKSRKSMGSSGYGSTPNLSIDGSVSDDDKRESDTSPSTPSPTTECPANFKVSDILADDPNARPQEPCTQGPTPQIVQLDYLMKGIRGCAVKLIEWAQRIPAFAHLSFEDQIRLLKASWCELYVLHLAAHNRPNCDTLVLGGGVTCKRDQIGDPEVGHLVNRISGEVSACFESLSTEPVELACLKGILLFNPGMLLVDIHNMLS